MNEYAQRCRERALEKGHHAWVQEDGSIKVVSDSRPGLSHRVTFETNGSFVQFHCDCESGDYRAWELIPCWHAARAGLRLEREGLARWIGDAWISTLPQREQLPLDSSEGGGGQTVRDPGSEPAAQGDPLEGLPKPTPEFIREPERTSR